MLGDLLIDAVARHRAKGTKLLVRRDARRRSIARQLLARRLFSWFQSVADFLLVRNITAWTGAGGTAGGALGGGALPDQTHALVVLATYTLVLGAAAFWLFERHDVAGATGGS